MQCVSHSPLYNIHLSPANTPQYALLCSGGGKSTLATLVMGLYEAQEGSILVDGVPLADLDVHWWRRQLGVVMQDAGGRGQRSYGGLVSAGGIV